MEAIKGSQLAEFPLDLIDVADLIYFDGPLLTLFENQTGDCYYFYYWCDVDSSCNRWLVFRVTTKQIKRYLLQNLSLRELVLNPVDGYYFLCDLDDDLQYHQVWLVKPAHLPDSYLPKPDSYHKKGLGLRPEEEFMVLEKFFGREVLPTVSRPGRNKLVGRKRKVDLSVA